MKEVTFDAYLYADKIIFDISYYTKSFNQKGYDNYQGVSDATDSYITREYERIKTEYTLAVLQTWTVLDVGCGFGTLVKLMRADGINCVGIDSSSYAISQDVTGGFISQVDIVTENTYKKNEFDLVISMYMLECLVGVDLSATLVNVESAVIDMDRIGRELYLTSSRTSPSHHTFTEEEITTELENIVSPKTVTVDSGIAFEPSIRAIVK